MPFTNVIAINNGAVAEGCGSTGNVFPNASCRVPCPRDGSLSNLIFNVSSNTLNGPGVLHLLVNGVSVASTTYLAGATGIKAVAGVFPVSEGDLISFKMDGTGAGAGIAYVAGSCLLT